jgi:hypothetical protein
MKNNKLLKNNKLPSYKRNKKKTNDVCNDNYTPPRREIKDIR